MPVIRIEVPKGTADATQVAIRIAVKEAVLKTLAPKETKYDYVAVREVIAEIGDGAPLIEVDLRPGREPARKKALVDAIAAILHAEMGWRRTTSTSSSARRRPTITTPAERHCPLGFQRTFEAVPHLSRHALMSLHTPGFLGAVGKCGRNQTTWSHH